MERIPDFSSPYVPGSSYTLTARVVLPSAHEHGILISQGTAFGGYAFYMKEGRLAFHYNALGPNQYRVKSDAPIEAGAHTLTARFDVAQRKPGSGGTVTLSVDGKTVAQGEIAKTLPGRMSLSLDVGKTTQSPVTSEFGMHDNRFSGELTSVELHIDR
jgi:arylsulfatase